MVARRTLLLGGLSTAVLAAAGGYAAVDDGLLPGRVRLAELTGRCDVDATPPRTGAHVESGTFASVARSQRVGWSLAIPPGVNADGLPPAIVLHGRGGNHATAFEQLRLHDFLAVHVRSGGRPFALASADGGDTYWHPRRSGDDPIAMLTREFLPLLEKRGLRTDHVAVTGWSMGGYGALLLARESHRGNLDAVRVVGAAAASPALFASYRASAPGAFDNEADFAKYGDLCARPDVGDTRLFVACGADDAFTEEAKRYRAAVSPQPAGGISKGCHTPGYWRSVAAEQVAFLGRQFG